MPKGLYPGGHSPDRKGRQQEDRTVSPFVGLQSISIFKVRNCKRTKQRDSYCQRRYPEQPIIDAFSELLDQNLQSIETDRDRIYKMCGPLSDLRFTRCAQLSPLIARPSCQQALPIPLGGSASLMPSILLPAENEM